jgi:hypothetical protein
LPAGKAIKDAGSSVSESSLGSLRDVESLAVDPNSADACVPPNTARERVSEEPLWPEARKPLLDGKTCWNGGNGGSIEKDWNGRLGVIEPIGIRTV